MRGACLTAEDQLSHGLGRQSLEGCLHMDVMYYRSMMMGRSLRDGVVGRRAWGAGGQSSWWARVDCRVMAAVAEGSDRLRIKCEKLTASGNYIVARACV